MRKVFYYECKRLLWNKFFFGLLLVLLFFGWQVLDRVTILGVSHTAPFSPWSFGDYLGRLLPLLWIGALFFLTFFTSAKARRVSVLTDAAPVPASPVRPRPVRRCPGRHVPPLPGCLAEAALFYGWYFHWFDWGSLLPCALTALLPPLLFALGSGWLLSQIRPRLLYLWMALPFLLTPLPLPEALSLLNGSFFTAYPLSLDALGSRLFPAGLCSHRSVPPDGFRRRPFPDRAAQKNEPFICPVTPEEAALSEIKRPANFLS